MRPKLAYGDTPKTVAMRCRSLRALTFTWRPGVYKHTRQRRHIEGTCLLIRSAFALFNPYACGVLAEEYAQLGVLRLTLYRRYREWTALTTVLQHDGDAYCSLNASAPCSSGITESRGDGYVYKGIAPMIYTCNCQREPVFSIGVDLSGLNVGVETRYINC